MSGSSNTTQSTETSNETSSRNHLLAQNSLKEIHYVPYNTSNSLTIYSYTRWRNRVLVTTKENFVKEIYFKQNTKLQEETEETKEKVEVVDEMKQIKLATSETTSSYDTLIGLEAVNEIHKFQKIAKGSLISSIDVIDLNEFCALSVAFTVV